MDEAERYAEELRSLIAMVIVGREIAASDMGCASWCELSTHVCSDASMVTMTVLDGDEERCYLTAAGAEYIAKNAVEIVENED